MKLVLSKNIFKPFLFPYVKEYRHTLIVLKKSVIRKYPKT